MSNFIVPNTFVPGTKARAQDVNENFIAVQNELNIKAEKNGDSSQTFLVADATQNNHAVSKSQVQALISEQADDLNETLNYFLTPFIIESAKTDSNGNPAFMYMSNNSTLCFYVTPPLIVIPANNKPKIVINTSLNSINMSTYSDGVYNIFVRSNKTAYALKNKIYIQNNRPSSPETNCIFVNSSTAIVTAEKYTGTSWQEFDDVYIGKVTVANGVITNVTPRKINDNGINVTVNNHAIITESYVNGNSWYRVWSDGWCEQGGSGSGGRATAYTIDLLKPYNNTNYSVIVGTKVTSFATQTAGAFAVRTINTDSIVVGACAYGNGSLSGYYWITKGYIN